jgi:two-component system, NarL family, sensor histidine kinase UhpB
VVPSRSAIKSQVNDAAEIPELSRQLLQAQEEERRRISRELHDETGQALMVLRLQLEMLLSEAKKHDQRSRIQDSLDLMDRTIEGLRRTIARLSPRVLEELGLITAIRRQAQLLTKHTAMHAQLELPANAGALGHDLEVALYRSVQEALQNIAKHSRARNFTIRLVLTRHRISLTIEDDGVGFVLSAARQKGFGLTGMRERAAALGGSVTVRSRPEEGTRVRIIFSVPRDNRQTRGASAKPLAHGNAA